MKKQLLKGVAVVALASLTLAGCKKESSETTGTGGGNDIAVARISRSVVNKVTGSACPPCGGWGWTAFEELINTNKGKAYFVGTYSQNFVAKDFITNIATTWDKAWGITGYPTFCASFTPQLSRTSSGVNVTKEKEMVNTEVSAHAAKAALANTAISTEWVEEAGWYKLKVKTHTKFFESTTGDYTLGVFLIKDKDKAPQSGHSSYPNATEHHYVLKQSMDEIAEKNWGDVIASGTIDANKVVTKEFSTYLPIDTEKANWSVLCVIFKKGTDGKYTFVNAASDQK